MPTFGPLLKGTRRIAARWLALSSLAACQTPADPSSGLSSVVHDESPKTFRRVSRIIKAIDPDLDEFAKPGPIPYRITNHPGVVVGKNTTISFDLIQPKNPKARGPAVILVHGNRSYKEAHRYQGEHLASFGFRVYLPQLPTTDVWATNGILLKTFTDWVVRRLPDKNSPKPILVGHSFGGSAVTMAAYLGTAVSGLILLDPAIFNDSVADLLGDTNCPAILLGADPKVFRSKQRSLFKKKFAGPFVELSLKGATHNDAQFPTMFSLSNFGLDPEVELKRQKLFTYLMTASAFSLSMDPNDQNSKGKRDDRLTLIRTLAKSLKKDGHISEFYQRPAI